MLNVVDGVSFNGSTYYTLVGGTGRFAGANGDLALHLGGTTIPGSQGDTAGVGCAGMIAGEIFFAGDDDDDDNNDD